MRAEIYRFGPLAFRLESDEPVRPDVFFSRFKSATSVPAYTVRLAAGPLPAPEGKPIFQTPHRSRWQNGETVRDYTFFSDSRSRIPVPYALAERTGAHILLTVDYPAPLWETMVFDALNAQDLFLAQNAPILHASFVKTEAGAILFAGPKQTGKSTQAALWQNAGLGTTVNGDRAAVTLTNGARAWGVPFCGTSRICLNDNAPLICVVFPEKNGDNVPVRLPYAEALRAVYAAVSHSRPDPAAAEAAITAAARIAAEVPCLLFPCTKDEPAVFALQKTIARFARE